MMGQIREIADFSIGVSLLKQVGAIDGFKSFVSANKWGLLEHRLHLRLLGPSFTHGYVSLQITQVLHSVLSNSVNMSRPAFNRGFGPNKFVTKLFCPMLRVWAFLMSLKRSVHCLPSAIAGPSSSSISFKRADMSSIWAFLSLLFCCSKDLFSLMVLALAMASLTLSLSASGFIFL